jgi:hypothetical protein
LVFDILDAISSTFTEGEMTARKGLRALALATLLGTAPATADEPLPLISLDEFAARVGHIPDPASQGYGIERCSALIGLYGHMMSSETDPKVRQAGQNALLQAEIFMTTANTFNMEGTTQSSQAIIAGTSRRVVELSKIYASRMEQVRLRTGNALDDPLLSSDVASCNVLFGKIAAAAKGK